MAAFVDRLTEPYRLGIESNYNYFIATYFSSEIFAEILILSILSIVFYWILGSLYAIIDLTEKPTFLHQYKIQKSSQVNTGSLGKLFRQVLTNQAMQIAFGSALIYFKYSYLEVQRFVPTLSRIVLEFLVFNICREVAFYYSHRLLHHPALYKYIHKRHHEWQTPIALAAVYCHPVEHFIANMFPVFIGPLLMHSHNLTMYIWTVYVIVETISAHSGYQFPLNPISPVFHDFHHLKFNTNYGIFGILDWFHETDIIFRKSKYYKLHRTYFSFSPPADLRYDADKMK